MISRCGLIKWQIKYKCEIWKKSYAKIAVLPSWSNFYYMKMYFLSQQGIFRRHCKHKSIWSAPSETVMKFYSLQLDFNFLHDPVFVWIFKKLIQSYILCTEGRWCFKRRNETSALWKAKSMAIRALMGLELHLGNLKSFGRTNRLFNCNV